MRLLLTFAALVLLACASSGAGVESLVFPARTDPRTVTALKRRVAYLMSLSEEKMLAIVPEQSGIYFTDCPNCDKGTQDQGPFSWSPERPHEIVCRGCGEKYPNNPKYPDDKVLLVAGPRGPQRYPYYERPGDHYRIFFRARADYFAKDYMAAQCRRLADLWWATRDERYARRAALILDRFAQVYPGYAYHMDLPFRQKRFSPWNKNRIRGAVAYRTAKWSWWAYMDVSLDLVRAYDRLRYWPGLAKIDHGRAARRIERDLLGAMVEFVMGFRETYSNMSPVLWRSVIYAGRVLRRDDYVAAAAKRFARFTETQFLYDGHWREPAPSYCAQVRGLLLAVSKALEGYAPAKPGRRPAVDPREVAARVDDVTYALLAPRLPDGRLLPVNDTWSRGRYRRRERMEPVLLPGLGAAVLGGGEGEDQLHVCLNYTRGSGHKHRDALGFTLFAFGKELLPDIGYTHTRYRSWTCSTMSHNTVVVDGKESRIDPRRTGNRLCAFVADGRGFQVAEAESLTAYPDAVSRYRRTLVAVGADARDAYVVDVFQVFGGGQHDYLLHGSADDDCKATVSGAKLKRFDGTLMNPGVEFHAPKGERFGVGREAAYGFVSALRAGAAGPEAKLDLRLAGPRRVGTRTRLFCEPGTTVYLGQAPSIRRAKEVDANLDRFQTPFFCARRRGKNLRSVFVAVHEPFRGRPKIDAASVRRFEGGVVVTVRRGARRDVVFAALDGPASLTAGDFAFSGRYGMAREQGGRVVEAHLVGASLVRVRDFELTASPAGWSGVIQRVTRRRGEGSRGWFDVAERIPAGASSGRRALVVRHPDGTTDAYTLVRVEPTGSGARLVVREDPGFELTPDGKTKQLAYPQRVIPGARHTYELLNAASLSRDR